MNTRPMIFASSLMHGSLTDASHAEAGCVGPKPKAWPAEPKPGPAEPKPGPAEPKSDIVVNSFEISLGTSRNNGMLKSGLRRRNGLVSLESQVTRWQLMISIFGSRALRVTLSKMLSILAPANTKIQYTGGVVSQLCTLQTLKAFRCWFQNNS